MNDSLINDNEQSVEGRDYKFETEVMNRMFGEYVRKYIDRIHKMDQVDSFVRDDSFHNVKSHNHIMYKLKFGKNEQTRLLSVDFGLSYRSKNQMKDRQKTCSLAYFSGINWKYIG